MGGGGGGQCGGEGISCERIEGLSIVVCGWLLMPHATFIPTRLLLLTGIRMYKCTFLQCIKIVYYHHA